MNKKSIPADLKSIILKEYPGSSISVFKQQGQNQFSQNLLLKKSSTETLLKVIYLEKIKNENDILNEVNCLEQCKGFNNIIKVISAKKINNYYLLEFPILDGENLSDYSKEKNWSEDDLKALTISILTGISNLSKKNIVHQDIKPENIFICNNNDIILLDFGSARINKYNNNHVKTNRHYSSPEQILAQRPGNLDLLRLTSDERSDIYSVGVILYELITKSLPFQTNQEKIDTKHAGTKKLNGYSKNFINLILSFLNYDPHLRPSAFEAIYLLQTGEVKNTVMPKGQFYYSASKSLKRFISAREISKELFSGVIMPASSTPPKEDMSYLFAETLTKIIDPETYLFQSPINANKDFVKLPYFRYALKNEDVGALNTISSFKNEDFTKILSKVNIENINDTNVKDFIDSVFNYETKTGANVLTPPFFLIKEFNHPSWDLDKKITENAQEIYTEKSISMPMIKGVALSHAVLTTDITRKKVLDYLTSPSLSKYSGYYVIFENNSSEEVMTSGDWLLAVKEFVSKLMITGKPIIWGNSSLFALVMSSIPGLSISVGEFQSQRNLYLPEEKKRGGPATDKIYSPKMFSRINWPIVDVLRSNKIYNDLICHDRCCDNVDFNTPQKRDAPDLATHFILQMAQQYKKYSEGGEAVAISDIEHAKKIYSSLKSDPSLLVKEALKKEMTPNSPSFLDTWISVLNK